jgi:hypothetical protein
LDEAFPFELDEGFADRGSAESKLPCKNGFSEGVSGLEFARDDFSAEGEQDLAGEVSALGWGGFGGGVRHGGDPEVSTL